MKINEKTHTSTGTRSDQQVSSWPAMLLARFLPLERRRITLLFASIAMVVFACALHSVRADLRPSSEAVRDDADAFGGPPHSIAFYSNRDGNNEIYLMNPDGSEQTRITMEARNDGRPDVSPNGKQIVFVSNRITETNPSPPGDFEIFVMNADGTGVTQLTVTTAPGVSAEAAVR